MLLRSKLNSIESKISEALINNEICHEDFMTHQELKKALEWWIVKEVILKKITWLKEEKKGINEVIKRNEIINKRLKPYI